jgi:hypothetical protein
MLNRRLAKLAAAVLVGVAIAFPLGVLASHQFADVPTNSPFHTDIDAIADVGVTTGCGGGNFCPQDFVTREQMAAFMNRLGAIQAGKEPVVNADKVDGIDSGGFVHGAGDAFIQNGNADLSNVVDPDENRTNLGSIPGLGSFTVGGATLGPGEDCDITFTNSSGGSLVVNGAANAPLADGASIELAGTGVRPSGVSNTFSIAALSAATVASGQVVLMYGVPGGQNVVCAGAVHALVSPLTES